jgi:hypothetical protein
MTLRSGIILILFSLSSAGLYSQDIPEMQDVIYLNNGTFLRGRIIEQVPEQFLRIIVAEKDTLLIAANEIKLMKKERTPGSPNPNYEDGIKVWGFTNITEFTVGLGQTEGKDRFKDLSTGETTFQLSTINGYTLSPYITLGLGTGFEFWTNRSFVPFFFDLRTNLFRKENTPFAYVDAGYSLGWINGELGASFGGALVGLGVGGKFGFGKKAAIIFSLSYCFQQINQWEVNNYIRAKTTMDAYFFKIRTGMIF